MNPPQSHIIDIPKDFPTPSTSLTRKKRIFEIHSKYMFFAVQVIISLAVIAFSMTQIIRNGDSSVYFSLLSGTVGYWFPSPTIPKKGDT